MRPRQLEKRRGRRSARGEQKRQNGRVGRRRGRRLVERTTSREREGSEVSESIFPILSVSVPVSDGSSFDIGAAVPGRVSSVLGLFILIQSCCCFHSNCAGIGVSVLELEVSNSGLPSFDPAVLRFDVFEFEVEALPTVHTLFPKCTSDPGKIRSRGRRILYLIYCSLARASNDVYLEIQSHLPNPAPLAYFNREYLAISLIAILKILRTGFAEQRV
jgi:hypothetical protein